MTGSLVVVSGTGTNVGKTHFAEALLLALGRSGVRCAGIKPVETGFSDLNASDAGRLDNASSFHVKHEGIRFEDPVSPHIAARDAGRPTSLSALADDARQVQAQCAVTLVELAGGLFSPLTETETNAHLVALLRPDLHLLVAPDRLGVLHDLIASCRAAEAMGVVVDGVVLVAVEHPDTSSGRNGPEIPRLLELPLLATVRRSPSPVLAGAPDVAALASRIEHLAR